MAGLVVRSIIVALLSCCLILLTVMAIHAFNASKNSGAAAAQGDLGFFLILVVVSPLVVVLTTLSVWFYTLVRPRTGRPRSDLRLTVMLCFLNFLALAWNWVYLLFFWRS